MSSAVMVPLPRACCGGAACGGDEDKEEEAAGRSHSGEEAAGERAQGAEEPRNVAPPGAGAGVGGGALAADPLSSRPAPSAAAADAVEAPSLSSPLPACCGPARCWKDRVMSPSVSRKHTSFACHRCGGGHGRAAARGMTSPARMRVSKQPPRAHQRRRLLRQQREAVARQLEAPRRELRRGAEELRERGLLPAAEGLEGEVVRRAGLADGPEHFLVAAGEEEGLDGEGELGGDGRGHLARGVGVRAAQVHNGGHGGQEPAPPVELGMK